MKSQLIEDANPYGAVYDDRPDGECDMPPKYKNSTRNSMPRVLVANKLKHWVPEKYR